MVDPRLGLHACYQLHRHVDNPVAIGQSSDKSRDVTPMAGDDWRSSRYEGTSSGLIDYCPSSAPGLRDTGPRADWPDLFRETVELLVPFHVKHGSVAPGEAVRWARKRGCNGCFGETRSWRHGLSSDDPPHMLESIQRFHRAQRRTAGSTRPRRCRQQCADAGHSGPRTVHCAISVCTVRWNVPTSTSVTTSQCSLFRAVGANAALPAVKRTPKDSATKNCDP